MTQPAKGPVRTAPRVRNVFGWGWEDDAATDAEHELLRQVLGGLFGIPLRSPGPRPRVDDLELPPPRLTVPDRLGVRSSVVPADRALRAYGRSYRDVVRAARAEFPNPPDLVVSPRDATEVARVLDWCATVGAVAIPHGGGSSVVGGVEPPPRERCRAAVSIDLGAMALVREVDSVSRAARIEAGVFGPDLERQLRPYGLTLRHFPQSFECSTLGGWIATRSGGHYATRWTHIDELVESLRVVTPAGTVETRRLPASGAGPAPERLFLGSEGVLGIIVDAWLRLHPRPRWRARASVRFTDFMAGAAAVRAIVQSDLLPANCRLLDAREALLAGAGDGAAAVLLLGFESADRPPAAEMRRALEIAGDCGGIVPPQAGHVLTADETLTDDAAAAAWRRAFLRMPYLRDAMVALGCLAETFETAVTWDRFPAFHAGVIAATESALQTVCGAGVVTARFTHVYPDGPAPYYTVLAPARPGAELDQWAEVKAAASEAVLALGGTITHHHGVGREHRPWYDRERPELFAAGLRAMKRVLDPAGILNPGVLLDP